MSKIQKSREETPGPRRALGPAHLISALRPPTPPPPGDPEANPGRPPLCGASCPTVTHPTVPGLSVSCAHVTRRCWFPRRAHSSTPPGTPLGPLPQTQHEHIRPLAPQPPHGHSARGTLTGGFAVYHCPFLSVSIPSITVLHISRGLSSASTVKSERPPVKDLNAREMATSVDMSPDMSPVFQCTVLITDRSASLTMNPSGSVLDLHHTSWARPNVPYTVGSS